MTGKDPFDHPFFRDDYNPWRDDSARKTISWATKAFAALWFMAFVLSGALAVGIIYVAWHFISMWW